MNKLTKILAAIMLLAIIQTACVSKNANTAPDPATGQAPPAYVADPRIAGISNTATGLAAAVAPINPWAGLTDYALKAGFGLAGLIAGFLAQRKNTQAAQADATQKQSMLNTVIKGVEDAGTAAAAVKAAIQTRATAAGVQPQLDAVVQTLTS